MSSTEETKTLWHCMGWALLQEGPDQNLDGVHASLVPCDGCPVCGAVWSDLVGVGFMAPTIFIGRADLETFSVTCQQKAVIVASRVRCYSGHMVDYDAMIRITRPSPMPVSAGILGVLGFRIIAMAATPLFGRR